jgi:ubiquitin C-terminal hydrolase
LNKKNIVSKSTPLTDELQSIYKELWVNGNAIAPYKFLRTLQSALKNSINILEQNDICEFLILYLDKLNQDMSVEIIVDDHILAEMKQKALVYNNEQFSGLVYSMDLAWLNSCKKEYSPVIDLFYGQQVTQIICGNCKYIHHNYEIFSSLSLPLPCKNTDEIPTLYDACNILFQNEYLNTHEKEWKCDKCNHEVKSSKCTRLWKLPKILIVTIKRFDHTLRKSNSPLKVPTKLDMKRYKLFKDTYRNYKLASICFHYGSANSGHYVALCRHPTNKWFLADDQLIRQAEETEVKHAKNNGYIYFYEACT